MQISCTTQNYIEVDPDIQWGSKYYHVQQYFDGPFLKLDDHFKMVTFLKALDCDLRKNNSCVKLAFVEDIGDMVDEIAGEENINLSLVFVS